MFESVLGVSQDTQSSMATIFSKYAAATAVVVRESFESDSHQEKIEYITRIIEDDHGIAFKDYQEAIIEYGDDYRIAAGEFFIDFVEKHLITATDTEGWVKDLDSNLEEIRNKLSELCGLIERLNKLFSSQGFSYDIDENRVLDDLQKFYMYLSPQEEQTVTENIWISNQLFCTRLGLNDWNKRQFKKMHDSDTRGVLPQSLSDLLESLRLFYIRMETSGASNLDYRLFGETVEVLLEVLSMLIFRSHTAISNSSSEKFKGGVLVYADQFLEVMTKTPAQLLGGTHNDNVQENHSGEKIRRAILLRKESSAKRISCDKEKFRLYQQSFSPQGRLSTVVDLPKDNESDGSAVIKYDEIGNTAKLGLGKSITSIPGEIKARKKLIDKIAELRSTSNQLKSVKKEYEDCLQALREYHRILVENTVAIMDGAKEKEGLEATSMALSGVAIASSVVLAGSSLGGKSESGTGAKDSKAVQVASAGTMIASMIASGIAADKLNQLNKGIKGSEERIEKSKHVVQNPDEIKALENKIQELEAEEFQLQSEVNAMEQDVKRRKSQTKKGKGTLIAGLSVLLIGLLIFSVTCCSYTSTSSSSGSSGTLKSSTYESSGKSSSSSSSKSGSSSKSSSGSAANSTSSTSAASSYILPSSDAQYYSEAELATLSDFELYIARNEIYARHGREFNNQDLQDYFSNKDWYTPRYSPESFDSIVTLNAYEKKNAETILAIEKRRGSSYLS